MQTHSSQDTHPDKVHFCAALHEGPDLGAEFLPHAFYIMKHSQFLESLIHLESRGDPRGSRKKKERQRHEKGSGSITAALSQSSCHPQGVPPAAPTPKAGEATRAVSSIQPGSVWRLSLWKSQKSEELAQYTPSGTTFTVLPVILAGFWTGTPGPGSLPQP